MLKMNIRSGPIGKLISRFVHSHVLSITKQYKHRTTSKASLQFIQPFKKMENSLMKCAPYLNNYVKAITP